MIDGLRIKRADGTWTDPGGGVEQWVEPPPDMQISSGSRLFQDWTWLATAPMLDTSNVTDMSHMFSGCTSLTEVPLLDTSNVTTMANMFNGCTSLTEVPLLDTSNVTTMGNTFYGCTSLTEVPLLDTSNVTNMGNTFYGCTSLTAIELDMSSISASTTFWGSNTSNALISLTSLLTHGLTRTISVRWTAMEAPALNAWFDSLGQAQSGATVTITDAPGAAACDRTIATNKGWTVVD